MTDDEKPKEEKRGQFPISGNLGSSYALTPRDQIEKKIDAMNEIIGLPDQPASLKCDKCPLTPESDECKLYRQNFDVCERYKQPPAA
ncbi:Uncharacterised protein [uncultured archaeon]|nr:Uncharacterised protein [uncultured archaeon]